MSLILIKITTCPKLITNQGKGISSVSFLVTLNYASLKSILPSFVDDLSRVNTAIEFASRRILLHLNTVMNRSILPRRIGSALRIFSRIYTRYIYIDALFRRIIYL